jgi:hypothetical protein
MEHDNAANGGAASADSAEGPTRAAKERDFIMELAGRMKVPVHNRKWVGNQKEKWGGGRVVSHCCLVLSQFYSVKPATTVSTSTHIYGT